MMLEEPQVRRPVPSLSMALEIEAIIRDATWAGESPISLGELKRRMHQKAPKHAQVRDVVNYLLYHDRIVETPDGVEYAFMSRETAAHLEATPL